MKSYEGFDRKYELSSEEDLSKQVNATLFNLFDGYEKLSDENIITLRVIIKSIFSHIRSEELENIDYKNRLEDLLYPDISFVGLSKLYSNDKHLQLKFLEIINEELNTELSKDSQKTIKKIK